MVSSVSALFFSFIWKGGGGWVTDRLKVQSVAGSLAATDDWQQADGFPHAEPREKKG